MSAVRMPKPDALKAITRFMQPKSIAIVGMSAKLNTVGHQVLKNLLVNEFEGEIYLIGRSGGEIDGHTILTSFEDVPEGIDVAVLTLPAAGVSEALEGCIARKVGVAVIFASGFAEQGHEGRVQQDRLRDTVRAAGLSVIGPNCLGYTSYNDGFMIGFVNVVKVTKNTEGTKDAIGIVGQSGSVQAHLAGSLLARGVDLSYNISTGNQMDLGFGDFITYLLDDHSTNVVAVYAEHIENPQSFLEAARHARSIGKSIVLLHPGRSIKAQEAAKSHTGALAGDYKIMRAKLEREGVIMADSLDEFLDVCELLARYPHITGGGLGIATLSGAFCGVAQDFCEGLAVEIPDLAPTTVATLKEKLPAYAIPKNPLDLGTQPLFQHELVEIGARALLEDPAIGAVVMSLPPSSSANGMAFLKHVLAAKADSRKPLAIAVLYDAQPLPEPFMQLAKESKVILSRSSDRVMRAMAKVLRREKIASLRDELPASNRVKLSKLSKLSKLPTGPQAEWVGKQILKAAGIRTPDGELAKTYDQAVTVANRLGYPVALKAQASALEHKTEAGGVILSIKDDQTLHEAWRRMIANIERARPGLVLDGILVERMSEKGIELVVGARRDPQWGVVIVAGLGGIMVEALQDVRLLTPALSDEAIMAELDQLRAAKLLHGFRDVPPLDIPAVVKVIRTIDQIMTEEPEIQEIDVNPLMVYGTGQGATALDALIVTT